MNIGESLIQRLFPFIFGNGKKCKGEKMVTIKLTAEDVRMLEIQMSANPCTSGCPVELNRSDCYEMKNGKYVCPLQRTIASIEEQLKKGGEKEWLKGQKKH